MLAFDHRGVREDGRNVELVPGARHWIWEGSSARSRRARRRNSRHPGRSKYGRSRACGEGGRLQARDAREKSVRTAFDFEDGEQFGEKIEEWTRISRRSRPYNPEGDQEMNERQTARLPPACRMAPRAITASPLRAAVPAEPAQLGAGRRQRRRYDVELPRSDMEAILQVQNAAWSPTSGRSKASPIAGVRRDRGARTARGPDRVSSSCSVVAPPTRRVDEWLRAGAGLDGYIGSRRPLDLRRRPSRRTRGPAASTRSRDRGHRSPLPAPSSRSTRARAFLRNSPNRRGRGGRLLLPRPSSVKARHLVTSAPRFLDCCPHKALIAPPVGW